MVEDSVDDVVAVRRWLNKSEDRYELHVVDTIAAAKQSLARRRPHLVLLDLHLPDISGIATLEAILPVASGIPIVVFSGLADRSMAILAVRSGAEDFVLKDEVTSPEHLTRPMCLALERSRRRAAEHSLVAVENQMELAHRIQQMLLPDPTKSFEYLQWCGRCVPAERAGGDFYDLMDLPDGRLGFVIADVSGHGLVPAMIMMETRAILRAMAMMCDDPGTILTNANKILCRDVQLRYFVTLFLGFISADRKDINFASAGHPGYLFGAGEPSVTLASNSPPLGIVDSLIYESQWCKGALQKRTLLLFTDGLLNCVSENAEEQSFEFVVALARENAKSSIETIINSLFNGIEKSVAAERDDCTALLIRCSATP